MPEPLKNLYNQELITTLSQAISSSYNKFDSQGFCQYVIDETWSQKELKERMTHIAQSLHHFLPKNYAQALQILMDASSQFKGFEYMFFPNFVELYGLEKYQESIPALEHFTKYSSSEFAVRPFIKKYPDKMMQQMQKWATSENEHIRRLASEGCRPRLPWAMALPDFKKDPRPILPILEKLKNDQSEYVRRSVANNLNDISKDNPQIVLEIARDWLGNSPQVDWIVKHGCRTLFKRGEPQIMTLFGFPQPDHLQVKNLQVQPSVDIGELLNFSFQLVTKKAQIGKLRIEYAIDFRKQNGSLSRKVFKISESQITAPEKSVTKYHSFKKISTRKYYAGNHGITIIINGCEIAHQCFLLNPPNKII